MNTTGLDNRPAGLFPNPLLPVPSAGATLLAGSTTRFWVDITVPEDLAESGRVHPFTVQVSLGSDTVAVASGLRVFNFSVADQSLRTDSSVTGLDAKHWPEEGATYYYNPGRSRDEATAAWYVRVTHDVCSRQRYGACTHRAFHRARF